MLSRQAIGLVLGVFLSTAVPGVVEGGTATARLFVQIPVPPMLEYRILKNPSQLLINENDLNAGYKRLEDEIVLSTTTNNRNGYIIMVSVPAFPLFTSVTVSVGHQTFELPGESNVEIPMPYEGNGSRIKNLSFTFHLGPEAKAGRYAWPVMVTVNPL